jgi:hypothetical protein
MRWLWRNVSHQSSMMRCGYGMMRCGYGRTSGLSNCQHTLFHVPPQGARLMAFF